MSPRRCTGRILCDSVHRYTRCERQVVFGRIRFRHSLGLIWRVSLGVFVVSTHREHYIAMNVLCRWTDEILSRIKNAPTNNLVSLFLNKDQSQRPKTAIVLKRSIVVGRPASRPADVLPRWNVHLSYRAGSNESRGGAVYDLLVRKGLSIWFDWRCLELSQSWAKEFCAELMSSRCMVCLLSRGAINCH